MNAQEFRAQLETEMAWRMDEVLFFHNQCGQLSSEQDRERFRRAAVLILYSHFEGFCKFAFLLYVSVINQEKISCRDADYAIAAASLSDVFASLRNLETKSPEFRNDAPDDTKLHRLARDREFVQRSEEFLARQVFIPEEVVDTESNLKPIVLRKNLYRLGLPYDLFSDLETDVNSLLEIRNRIAHGAFQNGVKEALYERLRGVAFDIMTGVMVELTMAVDEQRFLAKKTA